MKASIDRIEKDIAVIIFQEDTSVILNIPLRHLPKVKEGDIVDITITKEESATEDTRQRVTLMIEKLKKKSEISH
jgi:hypothetical protein